MKDPVPSAPRRVTTGRSLDELRGRFWFCLICLTALSGALFFCGKSLLAIVKAPVAQLTQTLIFIGPAEALFSYLRIAVAGGLLLTFPVALYEAWLFLAPSLSKSVRLRFLLWLVISFALFVLGVCFSYFVAIPSALHFLIFFAREIAAPYIALDQYVSFFTTLLLVGGFTLEIPLLLVLVTDIGAARVESLERRRPLALVVIFIVASVVTPTQDILNLLVFVLPMYLLFEAGVFMSKTVERRRSGRRPGRDVHLPQEPFN